MSPWRRGSEQSSQSTGLLDSAAGYPQVSAPSLRLCASLSLCSLPPIHHGSSRYASLSLCRSDIIKHPDQSGPRESLQQCLPWKQSRLNLSLSLSLPRPPSLPYTHTHVLSHSLFSTHFLSLSLTHKLKFKMLILHSIFRNLYCQALSLAHFLSLSLCVTHSFALSPSLTHTRSLPAPPSLSAYPFVLSVTPSVGHSHLYSLPPLLPNTANSLSFSPPLAQHFSSSLHHLHRSPSLASFIRSGSHCQRGPPW